MMGTKIERVDNIPLILHWLMKMRIAEIIDSIFTPHGNWQGLSYGRLAVIFLTYIVHSLNHRLSRAESWVVKHKTVLETVTGWTIGDKDATDDRLGTLVEALGEDDRKIREFQLKNGQNIIQAFELKTKIARYDTSTFSVHHQPESSNKGILKNGHSKDRRPDLLQFKQGLGTLDPAGVPIFTETVAGNDADDNLYVPAWCRMVANIGHKDFMFIADCKAASMETRGFLSNEVGFYLFPLPMTGKTPELLKNYVLNPPIEPEKIVLGPKAADEMKEDAENRAVGEGFAVERQMETILPDGKLHKWEERWLVCQSYAHEKRKIKGFKKCLAKAEKKLKKLKVKKDESVSDFQKRAEQILKTHKVSDFIVLKIKESIKRKRKYIGRGRPGPNRSYKMGKVRTVTLSFKHDDTAIEKFKTLAGWRIYVSNIPEETMSLTQSARYYREEYVVEHGFHRLKKGCLPVLPLFLRIDERIRGLMLILTIALQALTLLEFAARRQLAKNNETLSGLVPGNPKMKTHRPTAERLLPAFDNLHMIIEEGRTQTKGYLLESLNGLQRKILDLLGIPLESYNLTFDQPKLKNSS